MKKFNVEITRADEYEFEVDENLCNQEALKEFSRYFHQVNSIKELLESLSFQIMRFGSGEFYEGFGYIKTLKFDGSQTNQYKGAEEVTEFYPGITLRLITEDDYHDYNTNELPN